MEEDEDAKLVFEIQKRICRCCLNSSKSMVYATSVREAFLELAGITVDSSDGLPQWICIQCLTLLRKAVRFRRKIQHMDNVLRDYLTRCAPFPIDELDPELSKYATQSLSQTQILQFDTDKTKNGYHKVLQHVKQMAAVFDIECKIEYDEPIVKLEQQYSDAEDDMPLLELRSNKEDSVLEDDGMTKTPSKSVKRKKDVKSRKKKKKYQNESEIHDESENQDESYKNVSILEPLESNDPLESLEELTDLEKTEISDENFQKRLHKKNQQKYLNTYKQFMRWKQEKNISSFAENVFLTYFNELDLKNKPTTLVNIYSMLKATMLAQNGINLGNFGKLKKFLKDRSKGYCVKASKVFNKEDIDRFLKTAPDDPFLTSKVVLIIGICGGCITPELINLTVHDLEIHANLILVKVQEKNNRERSFMIPENYSEYVKKYMDLRPKDLGFDRFLVHYKDGIFARMAMGKNKISAVPKEVAMFLNLQNPEKYTGHGFRRTFHALFDPKKGSANDFFESENDSESENRENESVIVRKDDNLANYDTTVSFNENLANSYDTTVSFNENMANTNDITASVRKDDNLANSYDTTVNFNENMANSSDITASGDEMVNDNNKTSSGIMLKVPEKSGKSYVRAYELFALWMQEKNLNNVTEEIMVDYFKHLSQEFRPSSLWNLFSMLRNTILTQNKVDIKKFERLKQFLRSNFEGFERRTSKVFTDSEIDLFLSSAPDYNYLAMKVVLLLGISGACTSHELTNLTTDCVKIQNNTIIVKIKDGNNKTRCFGISGHYYEYVKRYMDLRPKNLGHNRFFFPINNSNYTKQVIGKNTVRLVPREVASFLVLPNPEAYNGHCFKRTSAALFGTKACTIESENHSESENESHNESDNFQIENEPNIKHDSHNESENERIQIEYEPIVKIQNIKHDNFESHNESGNFQIDNLKIQIEYEPIITQNIKEETVENTTIQDNCTYIQEISTKTIKNSTDTRHNSTQIQENITNTQKLSTNIQENSTNTQEISTNTQENSTDSFTNLPEKSQRKYFHAYEFLQTWMIENDINSYSENVLLTYFQELSKKMKPSSLCSKYSMLRVTIKLRNGIDISNYMVLRNFINKNIRGFHSKKSRVFSLKEIEEFLKDAPDFKYLHWKVALIIGISGACKCQELLELSAENVKIRGKIITVKILSNNNRRKFFIKEKYVHIVKKYIDLRPNVFMDRFFLLFRKNRCVKQVMGKNSMGAIPKQIAKYLNLDNPEEYTGQCFRRTSFSLFGGKDENTDNLNNIEEVVKKRSSVRKHLELDPEKIRVITLNPEEQIRQREEETKNLVNFMYHCKLCFKGFNFESKLENHMAKHSPSRGKYLCTVCQMYLPTMYSYSVHMLIHTRRYECVKCQRRMIDRQSIYNHYRTQHEGITMIIKCDICGKESSNDKTHRSHMRNHHSGSRPECDQCGKTFVNKDSLTEHILIHSGEKKYACPICDKRCRSRAHVKNHMKMHSDVKEFYCVECDVRFKSAHNLRVHLTKSLKHKDEMSFKFPCSECPRRFESGARLAAHTRVQHLGVRAHACSACGARLASRAGLAAHARAVHARAARAPPTHVCHACGRAFRGKSVLINHMRVHTGEKPYSCGVCARSFSQRTALRTHHKLVHLKIKQKAQGPLVEKTEQLFPKAEPQPTFDAWTRPCEFNSFI